jgi:hypothetical protein
MFSQVVQGRTNDPAAVRRAVRRWAQHRPSSAAGWPGSVAGVTQDGRFIAVVGFESEDDAVTLPGPAGVWDAVLEGEVTLTDGTRTDVFTPGDPARAGFVQVVQGQVTDLAAARRHKDALQEQLRVHLPCVLGAVTIEHDTNRFTRALYFSTEEEAREGERNVPAEVRRLDEQALTLLVGPLQFLDLQEPWFFSP